MKARANSKPKITLSVGMIVKNEEANLEKCLEGLQPLLQAVSSELIIVDTGSTDTTMEIAARYTDKLYQYEWNDDFSAARNKTLEYSSGEWFMYIDADEWLNDCDEIIAFFTDKKELEQYNSATFIIRNYTDFDMSEHHDFYAARLVRRLPNVKFESRIHEYLVRYAPCKTLYTFAHHFGYATNTKDGKKTSRNLPILLDMWENHPEEHPGHTCFQIAREYGSQGELDNAIKFNRLGIECLKPHEKTLRCGLYHDLVMGLYFQFKWDEVLAVSEEFLSGKDHDYSTDIDIRFYRASAYKKIKETEKALAELEEYFRLVERLDLRQLDVSDRTTVTLFSMEKLYRNACRLDYAELLTEMARYDETLCALDQIDGWVGVVDSTYFAIESTAIINTHDWGRYAQKYPARVQDQEHYSLFCQCIDEQIDKFDEARIEIGKAFAQLDAPEDPYVLSILFKADLPGVDVDERLKKVMPSLPADESSFELVYYALRDKIDFEPYVSRIDADDLTSYVAIIGGRENMGDYVSDYYEMFPNPATLAGKRWKCALMEHLLLTADAEFEHHRNNFISYCTTLSDLTFSIYGESISDEAFTVIPHVHRFGIFMRRALAEKEKGNVSAYLRNLTKAGEAYPYLVHFIKYLVDEQKMELEKVNSAQNEAALLIAQLKDKIQELIFAGDLDNARAILEQYAKLRPEDKDIEWLNMQLQPVDDIFS